MSWHMSPWYGHGILVSGCPVLTAVNWPYCECPILKSYIKDVDLPRHAWDTPPFLLIVSPTPPVQSVDAYVRTCVRTLGQSRDNQTKRGWPYFMGIGLCPTRASRAREPRYDPFFFFSQSTMIPVAVSCHPSGVSKNQWNKRALFDFLHPTGVQFLFLTLMLAVDLFWSEANIRLCVRLTNPNVENSRAFPHPTAKSVNVDPGIRCSAVRTRGQPAQFGRHYIPSFAFRLQNHAARYVFRRRTVP